MTLTDQLDRLARVEPVPYPVVSLYLNTQPNEHGRDQFHRFVRQEFKARGQTYPAGSPERDSLDKDLERISRYLDFELQPSANGVALFACSAADLFEAVQLTAPIDRHSLYISDVPHLYPLARLESQYPRHAAVVADTNTARILVFATGELVAQREVNGFKTRKTQQGGWSQSRFQRHISNFHVQHAKEVVEALDRIVQQEGIEQVFIAGDEVILPLLRDQMPKHLADKVVDHLRLDTKAPVHDVLTATLEALGRFNERTDREKVAAALDEYRAGGLGVVGPEATLDALVKGQVDELLLAANVNTLHRLAPDRSATLGLSAELANDSTLLEPAVDTTAAGEAAQADPQVVRLADEFVSRARQTGARVTFIEDASLLQPYGGVAALLRFKV
ncbi:MAG TPA: Vms1/Ankzf1 family peptidyl-tRNA hydrolase [Vicinamibacterales bacterium]|nr:Vms1/Ankzf1 family peptidyl-tRNA hydrolase [Vicinamibacterales bacterium]